MHHNFNLTTISTLPPIHSHKDMAEEQNILLIHELSVLQDKLYAQNKYSVLIILQGMDTAGKDSAVKHVFSGVNPAGCNVKSFKVPSHEEAAHHFLWRVSQCSPARGMIQIFNRSHYEDILIPKIKHGYSDKILKQRCHEINMFEQGLINNNTIIIKFYLHISHDEQIIRLEERKTNKHKQWKYQKQDIADIAKHKMYKKAYEFIFKNCSESKEWLIIPADKKWHKNNLILNAIVHELNKYKIEYPLIKI